MVWTRASASEYDAWEQFGSSNWTFEGLLPYFKRSESISSAPNPYPGISNPGQRAPANFNGFNGPVQVCFLFCSHSVQLFIGCGGFFFARIGRAYLVLSPDCDHFRGNAQQCRHCSQCILGMLDILLFILKKTLIYLICSKTVARRVP
jgi:hypothetical protein